ncbi:helix-turn-helix domain-containing protein [Pararhizobium qamdonense]|uniref:helix-turn-helix domain-containing protein n=1 Tax=Pararhizobium qamdonense TaxID=3031126 RepID=UPI0023E0FE6A|nr:helix-turn-helix transcriptional regulator [Pararhizobium qamdonense]
MTKIKPAPTNRIAEVRKRQGLTQSQLADKVGVHWITISKLERGQITFTEEWRYRLGAAMDVDADIFLPTNRRLTTIEVQGEIMPGGIVEMYGTEEDQHTFTLWNGAFHALNKLWLYVNTDALYPLYHDEDLLCFARNDSIDGLKLVNRFCMVFGTDENGADRQVFGYPHLTAKADHYTILVPNGPPVTNLKAEIFFPLVSVFFHIPSIDDEDEERD